MVPLRAQLEREISALYGFVDSIAAPCVSAPQAVAFTESSSRFFDYIEHLADATKKHLDTFPIDVDASDDDFQQSRDELWTIRSAWKELHQFIKPAADADTLNQPTALVKAMLGRVKKLPELGEADFAIFHTDSFDYLHVNPTSIRNTAQQLGFIVSAEGFPQGLGLIGIPGSQGRALFLNCLVAHEIGEYVYAEKKVDPILWSEAESAVQIVLGEDYKKKGASDRSILIGIVLKWCKEIFCDLFAIHLIGPCYSFAYLELFDLPNLLDKNGATAVRKRQPQIRFYGAHPSHPFRVKYQVDLLKRLDWWPHIRGIDSRYVKVLDALLAVDDNEFIEADEGEKKLLVEAFFKVLPEIAVQLGKIVGALDPGVHEFVELRKDITGYLQEGIVPSTVNVEFSKGEIRQVTPTVVALLNASACFYLEGIEKLMSRIENQDTRSAEQRVYWARKVESWTSKALEDISLMSET